MTVTANPNKALWEKGDFTQVAEAMRASGEALVARLGITPGTRVLDLGCGDGTTALPAARLGAEVLGVDIAGNLVAAGNQRAEAEGLTKCRFQEGDASHLDDLADDSFDLVVSIFGAMFAPRPFDVAKEMVRVTRPGGRIVMGNWIPGDPTLVAQILKISSSYSPPPPEGFISPMTWGVEENVIERFAQAGVPADRIDFSRETYTFEYPAAPTELLAVFRTYYGPTMNAFAAAEANGRTEELQQELAALFTSQNTSPNADTTSIPATYLQVSVHGLMKGSISPAHAKHGRHYRGAPMTEQLQQDDIAAVRRRGVRFKPSLAVPLRAVQCRAPLKNGDEAGRRCKEKAILGGLVCRSHGAQLPAVQQAAARAVEDARLRLLLATEDAVVVLETLMDAGQSEVVRLRAAVEILDRAGIRGGIELRPLPVQDSPSAILEQRLSDLARRMADRVSGTCLWQVT